MRNLVGFCSPCLAHSNSSLAERISIGLALSCNQGSAATHWPLNESSSFAISINDSTLASVCYTVIYIVRVGLGLV